VPPRLLPLRQAVLRPLPQRQPLLAATTASLYQGLPSSQFCRTSLTPAGGAAGWRSSGRGLLGAWGDLDHLHLNYNLYRTTSTATITPTTALATAPHSRAHHHLPRPCLANCMGSNTSSCRPGHRQGTTRRTRCATTRCQITHLPFPHPPLGF